MERVLDYVAEHDLQCDERFTEAFVRSRVRKGYGPVKIRQELSSRGVDEQALEAYLTEPPDYWLQIARRALEKKFGSPGDAFFCAASARHNATEAQQADEPDQQAADDRRQVWAVRARFLARRGFPSDLIYRLLDSTNA